MDRERKKRIQTVRLIITEAIMVIAVVITVIILTFVAMGYNVKNGELDQSGLIQVRSFPTGATVEIDGETIFSKTNTNRMVSAGEHKVVLSKEGYDTWEKTVTAESGWLLKLDYPKLFLKDRTAEKVREYEKSLQFFAVSPDRNALLYALEGSTKWTLLNIRNDEVLESTLDVTEFLDGYKILDLEWNENSTRVIVSAEKDGKKEWLLVNTENVKNSMNLSEEFALEFSDVKFATAAGERLYVLENGNLRTVVAGEKTVSQVLATGILEFYNREANVIYLTKNQEVKMYLEGASDVTVAEFSDGQKVQFVLSEYLSKKYVTMVVDQRMFVYRGEQWPTTKDGLTAMELVIESDLVDTPEKITVFSEEELILAQTGTKTAVFDAELLKLSQFETKSEAFIVDEYLVGEISDNTLYIRDFDGENRREISTATGRAVISKNSKWLYYLRVDNGKINIFRERIVN